jgi:hypothetical protein
VTPVGDAVAVPGVNDPARTRPLQDAFVLPVGSDRTRPRLSTSFSGNVTTKGWPALGVENTGVAA